MDDRAVAVRGDRITAVGTTAEVRDTNPNLPTLDAAEKAVLPDAEALVDWMSGTALVAYPDRLPEELHEPLMATYRERLHEWWPESPVFFGFRRILFATTRP